MFFGLIFLLIYFPCFLFIFKLLNKLAMDFEICTFKMLKEFLGNLKSLRWKEFIKLLFNFIKARKTQHFIADNINFCFMQYL
jgi:hypothetical protein